MTTQEEVHQGALKIINAFNSPPFFIGRNGSTEMELLAFWQIYRGRSSGDTWPEPLLKKLEQYSGIWPATSESVDAWLKAYTESLRSLTGVAAGWYAPYAVAEDMLLRTFAPKAFRTPLRSLEPYYADPDKRWSASLKGKRVTVISSFAKSIAKQMENPLGIWSAVESPETLLPDNVKTVQAFFPPLIARGDQTGWPAPVKGWSDAVDYLVEKTLETKPEVVLIGCGALGMIVGARLFQKGISVILMGGAVQVLFGIKGQRWANHSVISKFWNSKWVWPLPEERPSAATAIEGACYWDAGSKPSTTPR